jgi:peptide/nickel transport system substrate-binding protein
MSPTINRRGAMALSAAALAAVPAGQRAPVTLARGAAGVFVFGRGGDAVTLDAAASADGESGRVVAQIFDSLVAFSDGTTEPGPALAQSWEVSGDGRTYTFRLREGVRFHDGTPCDAGAVQWNFERWANPAHPGRAPGVPFAVYERFSGLADAVERAVALDGLTVAVSLRRPMATFLSNVARASLGVASPAAVLAGPEDAFRTPVGTGPFVLAEWVPGDHLVLERNPAYWGEPARLERVVLRVLPDNAARFMALLAGDLDMMDGANPEDVVAARGNPELAVVLRPSLNVGALNMNLRVRPFDDLRVRQALAAAVNRPQLVEALTGGTGTVATQLLPPAVLGWSPDVAGPSYDPDRARRLLAEAGYPSGFATDFWYMPIPRPMWPDTRAAAEVMAADFARVGVRTTLKTQEWAGYIAAMQRLDYPLWMTGWNNETGDPDDFLYAFFGRLGGDNSWDNAEVRALLAQAQTTAGRSEREALYGRVNTIVDQEVPRIPVVHTSAVLLARARVRGYVANPTGNDRFSTVWLDG